MIAPALMSGPSIVDLMIHSTRLWNHLWVAPLTGAPPPAPQVLIASAPALPPPAPPVTLPPLAPTAAQLTALAAAEAPITDHALLVLLGHFAQHLGLVTLLEAVPIAQKQVEHTPQTKLIEFLVGILAGIDYLQDLNDGPAPLAADRAVAHAWHQPGFAHYSGVSRTLAAADDTTLGAVQAALAQVSRPFIEREVQAILQSKRPLVVDIDLTGRPVSPRSTTYPDASFGWMDDAVAKGYQSAISSLSGGPTGRLVLASQRYSGHATSPACLPSAVGAVEAALGLRPRRRTAGVQAELEQLAATQAARQQTHQRVVTQQHRAQVRLGQLYGEPRATPAQRERQERRVLQLAGRVQRLERELWQLGQQHAARAAWLAHLTAENATLVVAVPVLLRLDAGFATDANLAWLWEMGYSVLTKVHSGHTTRRIQRAIPSDAVWTPVGANAEARAVGVQRIGDGRVPVEALQVRYHLPEGLRYTTLLYLGEAPPPPPEVWFGDYNGRQTVEAAIKENKGVFTMRRPLVRSPIGMQLQEDFALFAANFVRWAAAWVQAQVRNVPPTVGQALREVKTLVRVLAHSRAQLVETETGCALVFDAHSPFAGAVLVIHGAPIYQTVLPLFTIGAIAPQEVT